MGLGLDDAEDLVLAEDDPLTPLDEGRSFAFVSGLDNDRDNSRMNRAVFFQSNRSRPTKRSIMAAMKTDKGAGRLADPRMWRA